MRHELAREQPGFYPRELDVESGPVFWKRIELELIMDDVNPVFMSARITCLPAATRSPGPMSLLSRPHFAVGMSEAVERAARYRPKP